jgi:hypothetical protein
MGEKSKRKKRGTGAKVEIELRVPDAATVQDHGR